MRWRGTLLRLATQFSHVPQPDQTGGPAAPLGAGILYSDANGTLEAALPGAGPCRPVTAGTSTTMLGGTIGAASGRCRVGDAVTVLVIYNPSGLIYYRGVPSQVELRVDPAPGSTTSPLHIVETPHWEPRTLLTVQHS